MYNKKLPMKTQMIAILILLIVLQIILCVYNLINKIYLTIKNINSEWFLIVVNFSFKL